ncbi:Na+/H+ antiporter NhaC [Sessilibacter corallicola]|uniref:Na+/H+ antiporter NhaC family protein n=1 Tax=Sessilibacter corallicola TaxID=2904075 RepID=A0ABQ0AE98_9GAMM|nr:Na+/H+ antiporter NhaC [Sessilibacter corallicola]MCE2028323.1 Na+/H+ antiporter NhaC [Sessilibacter corallicola]
MTKTPSVGIATVPVVVLIILLSVNVLIFGDEAISGSNQIILIVSAAIAALLSMKTGVHWKTLEEGIVNGIKLATPAILILLMVGALSGTWLVSGIIPTMIYYGLHVLTPVIFLFATCIICAVVSVFTGSSWTTSATIGIALMGVGTVLGIEPGLIAGAILSGAYFGDKLSPLSDTTNLASASAGAELFTHIRYLSMTTIPTIGIALVLYIIFGFGYSSDTSDSTIDEIIQVLGSEFNISAWLLLVPLAVVLMIVKKVPALPALLAGTLLGGVFAFIFQPELIREVGEQTGAESYSYYVGIMQTLYGDVELVTGNEVLDELLTSGGMGGMLGTIWLILSAMTFGGVMESSGFLRSITEALIRRVKSLTGLVTAVTGTCLFTNFSASDQYLAVLLPGRMYADSFAERGLAPQNLSRTIEDSGTVTSVLIPWNTCGAYHATVLTVATGDYWMFAFFCLLSPLMSIIFAAFNIKIAKSATPDQSLNSTKLA